MSSYAWCVVTLITKQIKVSTQNQFLRKTNKKSTEEKWRVRLRGIEKIMIEGKVLRGVMIICYGLDWLLLSRNRKIPPHLKSLMPLDLDCLTFFFPSNSGHIKCNLGPLILFSNQDRLTIQSLLLFFPRLLKIFIKE